MEAETMTEETSSRWSAPPPVPKSVSEAAQEFLATTSAFAGAAPVPAPDDLEGWHATARLGDQLLVQMFAERLPADVALERTDFELDGIRTHVMRPSHVPDSHETPLFLDVHGGGLYMGAGEACVAMTALAAASRAMVTWAVDYRMPPEHPYPAGLDDCVAVYRKAVDERDPHNIIVGGSSAGGNLAAALLLRAKQQRLPMPAALVLLTPEVDLTETGDTFQTLLGVDSVLGSLMNANLLYANGHDLADPYLSPLFGDLSGFPPTYLQSGTRDLFLSNTVRMHRRLRAAGVDAELHVGEAMPHGGFGGATPEDRELQAELARFLERHLR